MLWYMFSLLVTMAMLFVAFCVMILSLNLQGYMEKGSALFIARLDAWAHILATNTLTSLIPTVAHVAVIAILNWIYKEIARWTSILEKHHTMTSFENSIIIKRFLFEFFDAFLPLFYLGMYRMNIKLLYSELVVLFIVDEFRRIGVETVLPWLTTRWEKWQLARTLEGGDHESVIRDHVLDYYESFDDYLEMVTQFGYIVLFPSAKGIGLLCPPHDVKAPQGKTCYGYWQLAICAESDDLHCYLDELLHVRLGHGPDERIAALVLPTQDRHGAHGVRGHTYEAGEGSLCGSYCIWY